eukprot:scaffold51506_cov63-Phaeocystis_antarctica.AAC.1
MPPYIQVSTCRSSTTSSRSAHSSLPALTPEHACASEPGSRVPRGGSSCLRAGPLAPPHPSAPPPRTNVVLAHALSSHASPLTLASQPHLIASQPHRSSLLLT